MRPSFNECQNEYRRITTELQQRDVVASSLRSLKKNLRTQIDSYQIAEPTPQLSWTGRILSLLWTPSSWNLSYRKAPSQTISENSEREIMLLDNEIERLYKEQKNLVEKLEDSNRRCFPKKTK